MRFCKLQAAGNDFVLVDSLTEPRECDWQELARLICDRHFGAGADGLIVVENSVMADAKMRIFNPDGSEAEVSGNGLRCFAKYVIEKGLIGAVKSQRSRIQPKSRALAVETLSGIRKVNASVSGAKVNRVQVGMGLPRFRPEQIPVKVEDSMASGPILDYPLTLDGEVLRLSFLSMGNPHAVNFSSQPVASFPLAEIGPKVERHPLFPKRTNFEISRVLSRAKIEARVWERGVGETLACGSGACAIAVVGQLLGYVDDVVDIILPGGILTVSWDRVGEVLLAGPVEEVFSGKWPGGQSQ
ncbi:MAG: diaminopimelate epimerase [Dehalococcoidia bacterium]